MDMHGKICCFDPHRRVKLIAIVATALLFISYRPAFAGDTLTVLAGTVTKVVDGDTLDVMLESGTIRIRLNGVDAPEKHQSWGQEATNYLSASVLNKLIEVEPISQDRYGRMIANLFESGQNINQALVREGYAWAFRKYMKKSDAALCTLEYQARATHRGLWRQQSPVPIAPWEFRNKATRGSVSRYADDQELDCIREIGTVR
jgi:micrococcal nuclease